MIHLLEAAYRNQYGDKPPDLLRNTYRLWKNAVDKFLSLLKETTSQSDMNIRFPNPITYRGKNRILAVYLLYAEYIYNRQNNKKSDLSIIGVDFSYGYSQNVVDRYKKIIQKDTIFVLAKQGDIISYESELNVDFPIIGKRMFDLTKKEVQKQCFIDPFESKVNRLFGN
jgi:hypothetical protein